MFKNAIKSALTGNSKKNAGKDGAATASARDASEEKATDYIDMRRTERRTQS